MASAKFLEEALSTDVDESAVSAIVGSLENQLVTSKPSVASVSTRLVSDQNQTINVSSDRYGRMSNYPSEIIPDHYRARISDVGVVTSTHSSTGEQVIMYPQSSQFNSSIPMSVGNLVSFPGGRQDIGGSSVLQSGGAQPPNRPTVLQQPLLSNVHSMHSYAKPLPSQQAVLPGMHLVNMVPHEPKAGPSRIMMGSPQVRAATSGAPGSIRWSPNLQQLSNSIPHQLQLPQPTIAPLASTTPPNMEPMLQQPMAFSAAAQRTSDTKEKCRKFLANLLDLSRNEPKAVELSVQNLIQELIDDQVGPDRFCERLEHLLKACPQPCLIGFLKKSLPIVRQSLVTKELIIEGIRPPPSHVAFPSALTAPPSHHQRTLASPVPILPKPLAVKASTSNMNNFPVHIQQQQTVRCASNAQPAFTMGGRSRAHSKPVFRVHEDVPLLPHPQYYPGPPTPHANVNSGARSFQFEGNLYPQCTSETIEVQTIPPKEYLIPFHEMQARIKAVSQRHGLAEPDPEVAAIMNSAAEEYVKRLLVKLVGITSHRLRNQSQQLEKDPRYEVSQDVKGQLKFLEELDLVDLKRREDSEREILLRAAKSRSKNEDPEQAKLKAKAKEMQRVEMEELRQREANVTALQAIGPRKRARLEPAGGAPASASAVSHAQAGPSGQASKPRVKRAVMRDLLFVMENERHLAHSVRLFRAYLK